jgi:hypothetical protein
MEAAVAAAINNGNRCKRSVLINSVQGASEWGLIYEISEGGLRVVSTQEYRLGQILLLTLKEGERTIGTVAGTVANAVYQEGVGWLARCFFHSWHDEATLGALCVGRRNPLKT